MYSWELQKFIEDRNYYLGGDDLLFAIDITKHPQLSHIKYNAFEKKYEMWDYEGNYFYFWAMPYEIAEQQGLVKKRTLKK